MPPSLGRPYQMFGPHGGPTSFAAFRARADEMWVMFTLRSRNRGGGVTERRTQSMLSVAGPPGAAVSFYDEIRRLCVDTHGEDVRLPLPHRLRRYDIINGQLFAPVCGGSAEPPPAQPDARADGEVEEETDIIQPDAAGGADDPPIPTPPERAAMMSGLGAATPLQPSPVQASGLDERFAGTIEADQAEARRMQIVLCNMAWERLKAGRGIDVV